MANVVFSVICVLVFCLYTVSSAPTQQENTTRYPVLLVPGLGGSQLKATLTMDSEASYSCEDYLAERDFSVWVSVYKMYYTIQCVLDVLTQKYDPTTRTTHNGEGITVDIHDFGSTYSIEELDPDYGLDYYYDIVKVLIDYGYQRSVNLFGAPYDFRKAPNEMGELFENLTLLIEHASSMNGGNPVVVVGHSMGNPVMLYFYNQKTQAWKDKFIKAHISLAGVWGGAVRALQCVTSGYNFGAGELVSALTVRPVERSMPSTAWMLPSKSFWKSDEVLISTYDRDYTVDDYEALFMNLGLPYGYDMWQDTKDLISDLEPPRVDFHCIHGDGVGTPESLFYTAAGFPDQQPDITFEDGDGTVNLRSLKGCLRWAGEQKQSFSHTVLNKVSHTDIVHDNRVFDYILNVAMPGN